MKLEAELSEPGPFGPGSWVRGRARVVEGGRSRALSVSLQYRERSPNYTHTAVEIPGGTLHTGDLQSGATFDFAIQMPGDALPGQTLHHSETFWQVDVKSDETGPDTHAVVRLPERPQPVAEPSPAAVPAGPPPTDGTGTPLLAPGFSAKGSGRKTGPGTIAAVLSIIVGIAAVGIGIAQVVDAFNGQETTTYTIPSYTPQPPTGFGSNPGSSPSLFDCLDRAGTDPIAHSRCISEYNNSVGSGER